MARIRTVKPEFWQDEKLAPCGALTRLVFLGLIGMADDAGRLLDNVKVIDAFIFPDTAETCRGSIDELSAIGRIRRGATASGQRVIEIANWSKHQKIEKPNLRAALPPIETESVATQSVTEIPRSIDDTPGNNRGSVDDESRNHTYDLRPTTNDLRPSSAGRQGDAPAVGGKKARTRSDPKWPTWTEADRKAAHGRWCERIGHVGYLPWVSALGPVYGGGVIAGASRADLDRAYESYLSAIAAGGPGTRFNNPAQCAKLLGALVQAWRDHKDDPMARLDRVDKIVHGRAAA